MKTFSAPIRNTRGNMVNHLPALLCAHVTREAQRITSDDMQLAYVGFNYAVPALEQAALPHAEPDFPAISGRIAYCNGVYVHDTATSVTYRRGRRMVTEWHALAAIRTV